jgi:hypothetical protein
MKLKSKFFGLVLIVGTCQLCRSYPQPGTPTSGGVLNFNPGAALAQEQYLYAVQAQQQAEQARLTAIQQATLQRIYSKDPWRAINGSTNYAGGNGWFEFQGLPQEAGPDGTIFKGKWNTPLTVYPVLDANHLTTSQDSAGSQSFSQKNK